MTYLKTLLESETRLAIAALGLDPGLGILHVDSQARDSLACDVMEPIRPQVDAYILNWISRETLKREWFFEGRDGSCRLMGSFAVRLAETLRTWGTAVAPVAEWVSQALWFTGAKRKSFGVTWIGGRHSFGTGRHIPQAGGKRLPSNMISNHSMGGFHPTIFLPWESANLPATA